MIEEIHLKNFRSFRDATIRLKPFSVFIGPNGSGKSNLVSSFEFMGRAVREDILAALSYLGDFTSVKNVNAGENESIEIEIAYRERGEIPLEEQQIGRKNPRKLTYHITVSLGSDGKPAVTEEWLRAKRPLLLGGGAPWYYLKVDKKGGRIASPAGESAQRQEIQSLVEQSSPYELTLAGSRSLKGYPQIQSFYKFLANWYISRFEPGRAREPMKYTKVLRLSGTGENLVLVVENLERYYKDILDDIIDAMKYKIPGFKNIQTQHLGDGKLYLSVGENSYPQGFPASVISDGTIRLLGMMLIMRDPDPPDLICIEEPENNLHPHLLEVLVDEFRTASERVQIIVTTHSPYLIDKCRRNEVFVMEKVNGESTINPIGNWLKGNLATLKGRTLGEMWYEGVFGGNP